MGLFRAAFDERPDEIRDLQIYPARQGVYPAFVVKVGFLTAKMKEIIADRSQEMTRGREKISPEKHSRVYTKYAVKGWTGLTVEGMKSELHLRLTKEGEAKIRENQQANNGEIPYSLEDAAELYQQVRVDIFANRIHAFLEDWDEQEEALEVAQRKKS